MTIQYKLDENDLLTHQLFIASKSDRVKKNRKRNKILGPIIYCILGLIIYFNADVMMSIIFFTIALLWFLFYPTLESNRYVKHYKSFINEHFKNRIGKTGTLELNNDYILAIEEGTESKISTSELEEICEIPLMIIVKLKGGHSFIIPKQNTIDFENVKTTLIELTKHLKINYTIDDKWEWK